MIKLIALTQYLKDRQVATPEQIDSWADRVKLELIWKPDVGGLHLGDMRYTATIIIESSAGHPGRLMALLGSWLEVNDKDRNELSAPVFEVSMLDSDTADVEIILEFIEPQYLAEDPAGEIEAFEKTWAFVPFDLWVAEHGEVASHGR